MPSRPSGRLGRLVVAARLVAHAYVVGVVHRDLKPANFLQGRDGIFLSDFGLATALDAFTKTAALEHLDQWRRA